MSVINNNGLVPVFAPAGGLGAPAPANAQGSAPGFPPFVRTDNIEAMPYQASAQDSYGPEPGDGYDQNTGGFGGVYNQLLGSISNLFSNLGSMFGYASNSGTSATGQAPTRSGGQGQKFFTTASASSVGDPHESFNGTTAAGTSIDQKWNSMISHPNLLDSNSFDGGYRVSTAVTQPSSAGITQNQSASVTTSGGATSVTMNHDGSYSVTSNGSARALTTGQPQNLGNGETVTLNADKSLTVVDNDATGGSITTTLRANGTGGVDVTNNAQNVDLGGSLFGHAEYRMDRGDENGVPGTTPYGTVSTPAAALSSFGFTAPFGEQTPSLSGSLENDIALM